MGYILIADAKTLYADDEWDVTIAKDGKEMKLSVSTVAEDRGLGDVAFA